MQFLNYNGSCEKITPDYYKFDFKNGFESECKPVFIVPPIYDVSFKKGIYEFLLSGKVLENKLNIRTFSDSIKLKVYTAQNGICKKCGKKCASIEEMEADHIVPWSKGGHTVLENCQMLCKNCNRTKSNS